MSNKILYLGAGLHTEVIDHFHKTNSFVFIDSRPFNEYGNDYYYRGFYQDKFLLKLFEKLNKQSFKKYDEIKFTNNFSEINRDYIESTCFYFYNKYGKNLRSEKSLKYFISTAIPLNLYDNTYLQKEIESCDTVLISGYYPHRDFLNYMKKPFNVIMYGDTYFPKDRLESYLEYNKYDDETVILHILKYPEIIKTYTHVNPETGECKHFETYNDFYKYYKDYKKGEKLNN